jgi:hypothetical protein
MTRARVAILVLVVAGAAAAFLFLRRPPTSPGSRRIAELTRERDELQRRWRDLVIAGGERSLAKAPPADLMIGVPTSLTRSILEQVVTGVFGQTTLTLANLRVRKTGEVKARMLIAKRTLGEYALDVEVLRVRGLLEAGAPTLDFGDDTVEVALPVRLAGGEGEADFRFRWDGKGVTDFVCGDMDVTRRIQGGVVPRDYELAGSFAIASVGESIVLTPHFPDLRVRVAVDPSAEAWRAVDAVIDERSKGCEIALDAMDVKERLVEILGRGFDIRIPQKIFKPIRLPAGVRQALRVQGVDLALHVKPKGVMVADDRLWYGADVDVTRAR